MTPDPQPLPINPHNPGPMAMTQIDRFAIVEVPAHRPAPTEAIVIGNLKEVMQYIPQSVARDDAIAELDRARFSADQISSMQNKTRAVQTVMLADTIKQLDARLAAHVQRRQDAARAAARRDEEEEQQRIQYELAALPDPDAPDPFEPTGELHALPAKVPEPELEIEDQSEFPDPDLPHPPVVSLPTAVGLDEEV